MDFKLFCACFSIISVIKGSGSLGLQKRNWDYTIISANANSSNEDILKWDVRAERIGRGEFGISGTMDVKKEFNDEQMTEVKAYRSATGGSQYEELPFKVKKQPLKDFMAGSYKTYMMEMYASCSDFPQAGENEVPKFEVKLYTMNKCQIPVDNFPSYMVPGFYKMQMISSGMVPNLFELVVEIEKKE